MDLCSHLPKVRIRAVGVWTAGRDPEEIQPKDHHDLRRWAMIVARVAQNGQVRGLIAMTPLIVAAHDSRRSNRPGKDMPPVTKMTAIRQTPIGDAGATVATHLVMETTYTPKSSLRDIAGPVPTNRILNLVLPRKQSRCHCPVHEQVEQARLQRLASLRGY